MSNEDIYPAALDYANAKLRLANAEMEYELANAKRSEIWKEVQAAEKLLGGFVEKKCESRLVLMEGGTAVMVRWVDVSERTFAEFYDAEGRLV